MALHTMKNDPMDLESPDPIDQETPDPLTFNASATIGTFVKEASEQGIHLRKAGVTMEYVSAEGLDSTFLEGKTFGDILCLPWTIIKGIRDSKMHNKMITILTNVSLLAKPGEMVLVLGRPGAGCSSLLKCAAGETSQFAGGVTGDISYDGIPQEEMMKHYKSDVIYNGELDVHFPYLTVKQTLDFAIACKMPTKRVNNVTKAEYIASNRDFYATMFGLTHTYDTRVGNDFISGISGGERKRVSIAEALAARGSIYCWDNATRGLDASTALEYAQAIRVSTNLLKSTALITLYQASENIYETFDKVTVLYAGRQVFYGEVTEAKNYFETMGYLCPPRQSTAEYLTALTDPNGLHKIRPGYEDQIPRTAEEFEKYWLASSNCVSLQREIQEYKQEIDTEKTRTIYNVSMEQEKSKGARKSSYYTISYWEQVKICTARGFQRIYGNKSYTVINTCAAIVQSFITGSLFYQSSPSTLGAFSRSGVLFFSLLYYSLMGLASISFDHRLILKKHKVYCLYHPSAEALASTISTFPFRMIGLTFFIIILYFLAGLHRSAGSFFMIYLFLTMCSEAITGLFQMISSLCDSLAQANSIAGILMLSIAMYSTYMIQLPSMHPWFKWISYVLPIRYAFESMLNAEFHGRHMDCGGTLVPSGPGFENVSPKNQVCAFVGSRPGQTWVLGDDYLKAQYQYEYKHTWRNFGIMWCFLIGYIILKALFTEFKDPVKGGGDALVFKKGTKNGVHESSRSNEKDEENLNLSLTAQDLKDMVSSSGANKHAEFDGLAATGVFIWKDVCLTIKYNKGERMLLDNVSGYCVPGTLTALIGESGAGKTTLLNTLAQRNVGIITGDILVNGLPINASFERRTGYVQQQDLHIAELTVKESLQFSARMRRSQFVSDAEKMEYVEKIMDILEMKGFSEALVGEVGYGLNVEQRKKLSIGVELVGKPDLLLFLDEPTSGLDSQSAWAIVKMLKRLALAGQSILCTIHQPSATLFEQFDRLLLLRKGGQTVYFGDIGKNSNVVLEYFERNGARKCQQSENPAEYILEAIGAGATASVEENWHDIWKTSPEIAKVDEKVSTMINDLSSASQNTDTSPSKYATSYSYQFKYVLVRSSLTFWRNLNYIMAKMMLLIISGLYIGFTFFHVGTSYIGLQNTMFACFMAIVISAPATNQIQDRATSAKELYEVRESKSNMFHWSLLLITQYLNELPYHLLFSTIFFVSFFFPLGIFFEVSRSGIVFLTYAIIFQLYYVGLALMILYASPNLQSANVIVGFLLSFLLSFCGVVQPAFLMPGFWTFMWKLSPYTYFLQNLVALMMHEKPVTCSKKELSVFNPPVGQTCGEFTKPYFKFGTGYIANPEATSDCEYCLYKVGDEYLAHLQASYSYLWRNFGFLWAYIIFNIFGMMAVYYVVQVRQFSPMNIGIVKKLIARFKRENS